MFKLLVLLLSGPKFRLLNNKLRFVMNLSSSYPTVQFLNLAEQCGFFLLGYAFKVECPLPNRMYSRAPNRRNSSKKTRLERKVMFFQETLGSFLFIFKAIPVVYLLYSNTLIRSLICITIKVNIKSSYSLVLLKASCCQCDYESLDDQS